MGTQGCEPCAKPRFTSGLFLSFWWVGIRVARGNAPRRYFWVRPLPNFYDIQSNSVRKRYIRWRFSDHMAHNRLGENESGASYHAGGTGPGGIWAGLAQSKLAARQTPKFLACEGFSRQRGCGCRLSSWRWWCALDYWCAEGQGGKMPNAPGLLPSAEPVWRDWGTWKKA